MTCHYCVIFFNKDHLIVWHKWNDPFHFSFILVLKLLNLVDLTLFSSNT